MIDEKKTGSLPLGATSAQGQLPERLCLTCGKAHVERQRTTNPRDGYTWSDPLDGHAFKSESWEQVSIRLYAERLAYTPPSPFAKRDNEQG